MNPELWQRMQMTHQGPIDNTGKRLSLEDLARGLSYLPYRLAGAPTDLGKALLSPLGLMDEGKTYMGESDWLINKAAEYGLTDKPTGSFGETVGDIVGQVATPGVGPTEAKVTSDLGSAALGMIFGARNQLRPSDFGVTPGDVNPNPRNQEFIRGLNPPVPNVTRDEALKQAMEGVPGRRIWENTGWFRAPWDRQWRFLNIPHRDEVYVSIPRDTRTVMSLPELLDYDRVYKAYPDLKDVRVEYGTKPRGSAALAQIVPNSVPNQDSNKFIMDTSSFPSMQDIIHETTHGVQNLEKGLASGTSTRWVGDKYGDRPDVTQLYRKHYNTYLKNHFSVTDKNATEDQRKLAAADARYKTYLMAGGEVEARTMEDLYGRTIHETDKLREEYPLAHYLRRLSQEGLALQPRYADSERWTEAEFEALRNLYDPGNVKHWAR